MTQDAMEFIHIRSSILTQDADTRIFSWLISFWGGQYHNARPRLARGKSDDAEMWYMDQSACR